MCRMIALAAFAAFTANAEIKIEIANEAKQGDVYIDDCLSSGDHILIGDFRWMVISDSDWANVTNLIATMGKKCEMLHAYYKGMNANETGRAAIHGRRGHTTVTNGTIVTEYADGYKHVETVKNNRVKPVQFRQRPAPAPREKSLAELKREAIRQKRKAALSRTNEVTVVKEIGK